MKTKPICLVDCGRWMGIILLAVLLHGSHVQRAVGAGQTIVHLPSITRNWSETITIVHLPSITRNWPAVLLSSAWTGGENGLSRNAFLPGETIRFYAGGPNQTGKPVLALMSISLSNDCETTTIFSGIVTLDPGSWSQYQTSIAPTCYGIHTVTVQLTYESYSASLSSRFVVNPPSQSVVRSHPAFDKCNIPSLGQLGTWWTSSPYYSINLYIGGVHRACSNSSLDAFWIHEASKQGWTFIPTWVGPQAPCTSFRYRISSDIPTAYLEGRADADQAALASRNLGFLGNQIIYYDMEGYSGATRACKDAVNSFIRGWVERLHELGLRAGVYGGSCSSYMYEWASISPSPDNVWIASWYASTYDPDAIVWGVRCLADSYWPDQQRIRQYTGGHGEDWGGVSMSIDSNVAGGEVTAILQANASSYIPNQNVEIEREGPQIQDMELINTDDGWSLIDGRLMWTRSSELGWEDLTPQLPASNIILAVDFLDSQTGLLLIQSLINGSLEVWKTSDGLRTWQTYPVQLSDPEISKMIRSGSINLMNPLSGSIILKLESSSNFDLRRILRTGDGGQSWIEDSDASGTTELDRTSNQDLSQAEISAPDGATRLDFLSSQYGWAIIEQNSCNGDKGSPNFQCDSRSTLVRTVNGGISWEVITP